MSSHSSYRPQEVLLAQFSLYMDNGGLKPLVMLGIKIGHTTMKRAMGILTLRTLMSTTLDIFCFFLTPV